MNIFVISDTHYPVSCSSLPEEIFKEFRSADMILHCGDLVSLDVIKMIEKKLPKIPLKAVRGNMDNAAAKDTLPEKCVLEIGKFKIGLTHGYGSPDGIISVLKRTFAGQKLDAIVFGHTHKPFNEILDNTLYFNPGSLCDKMFAEYNSYGILRIGDKIEGEIQRLK